MLQSLSALDTWLFLAVQRLRCPALDLPMTVLSRMDDLGLVWIVLALLLLLRKQSRRCGILMLCALLLETLLCVGLLKHLFARPRPFTMLEQIVLLVPPETGPSFPSGHAASSFACALLLSCCYGKRAGIPSCLLALFISFSRIYVGVHYPGDVLAGIVTGLLSGALVLLVSRLWEQRHVRRGE